ncbi:hypothetical protein [Parabacteroides pacaensis]|uniref:hypothetical protein n=1 Tax=Parabacteroides pacaensis TaxID=2086575 RepID=UPI000D0F0597|nr:hypothetical protein [Parabacteroides pacaensis]
MIYTFIVNYPAIGLRIKTYVFQNTAVDVKDAYIKWISNLKTNIFSQHAKDGLAENVSLELLPFSLNEVANVWCTTYADIKDFMMMHIVGTSEHPTPLYTFIVNYRKGVFVSQIEGTDPQSCFRQWIKKNAKYYPKYEVEKIETGLDNNTLSLVPIEGMNHPVWFFRYRFYKKYILELYVINTDLNQDYSSLEWE